MPYRRGRAARGSDVDMGPSRYKSYKSGTHRKMRKISSISESPGKRGWRITSSAKMHPTDHMSSAVE